MVESGRVTALTMTALEQAIAAVAPEALLMDARIVRRVIRLDRRLKGLGIRVPHDASYTIDRARLLAYVEDRELPPGLELPSTVILLSRPTDPEIAETEPHTLLLRYWRLLFHSMVHLHATERYSSPDEQQAIAELRRGQLGELEFEEIRNILLKDDLLFREHSDWDVYVEFLAVCLELRYFATDDLRLCFPAITNWQSVDTIVSQDIQHAELYRSSRLLPPDSEPSKSAKPKPSTVREKLEKIGESWSIGKPSDYEEWQRKAFSFASVGNHVKAALLWRIAAQGVTGKKSAHFREHSTREIGSLIEKLRRALQQTESPSEQWLACLNPVLDAATQSPWSTEARLLYDLQKICVEDESESRRADLLGWLKSLGRGTFTRRMPLLKYVLRTKAIHSAQRRLAKSNLGDADRKKLAELLSHAEQQFENQLRNAIRPVIHCQLDRVGMSPVNIPERVARNRLVEELLDNLVEYGYISSGTLRDGLSKGDLKLRDVSGMELLRGDQFLLADRYLSDPLDGVYRKAPIYLRWSQRLSSLAFGTQLGRFLTLHLALPFGGAFLLVEGVRHVIARFSGEGPNLSPSTMPVVDPSIPEVIFSEQTPRGESGVLLLVTWVLVAGLFIYLLMHRPKFRTFCSHYGSMALKWVHRVLVDWPTRLLRIRLVEQLLYGPTFAPLRTYLIKPGLLTGFILFVFQSFLPEVDLRNTLLIFLVLALLLNSSIGRYADEWFADQVLRTVDELRARVLGALFQWIMDAFQQLLVGLDRVLHTLDEWSRFRTRDLQWVKVVKFFTGTIWSIFAYFIVLVSTLLIEPQINPIKHFPVVTVSHKLLLPLGPFFVVWLSPFTGSAQANTLVWSTIWLIPGVFGFLVWELRGNWRLYAANRPTYLQSQPVGNHGETVVALLRPSFHSGTLPKLFARIRKAIQKSWLVSDSTQLVKHKVSLIGLERRVRRFVERELIELLTQSGTFRDNELNVHSVRLATNCIRITLVLSDSSRRHSQSLVPASERKSSGTGSQSEITIFWDGSSGQLVARVGDFELGLHKTAFQESNFSMAVAGFLQRVGSDRVLSEDLILSEQKINWNDWVDHWKCVSKSHELTKQSAEDSGLENTVADERSIF